jgi:hypothetical protein
MATRVFEYAPQDGSTSPVDQIGFGIVVPGQQYEATDEQAAVLAGNPDFKEVKGKAKADDVAPAAPTAPDLGSPAPAVAPPAPEAAQPPAGSTDAAPTVPDAGDQPSPTT